MSCPQCGKHAQSRPLNESAPFCGPRCKLLDLGQWVSEAYKISPDEARAPGDASVEHTDEQE